MSIAALSALWSPGSSAEVVPRERMLLDAGWRFHLGDDWGIARNLAKAGSGIGPASWVYSDASWRQVNLPHDWAIELPFDSRADGSHGFKALGEGFSQNNVGWYRRNMDLTADVAGKRIWLEFEGVFRDCTVYVNGWFVGRHESGYSGFRYDITDLAAHCEFEEVAHLLVHGRLPNAQELIAYKQRLVGLRWLPPEVKQALELLPPRSHPMDVLRTGVSVMGCVRPEPGDQGESGARAIADTLLAAQPSMLLYWFHFAHNGKRIDVETPLESHSDSIASHFLHLLHGKAPSALWTAAMQTSLILYAEHEFNASTFTARVIAGTGSDFYSAIAGAIGALKGPKHGGANEVALEIQRRYATPDEAEADIRRRVAGREELLRVDRLGHVVVHPRIQALVPVPGAGVGGHSDDG